MSKPYSALQIPSTKKGERAQRLTPDEEATPSQPLRQARAWPLCEHNRERSDLLGKDVR